MERRTDKTGARKMFREHDTPPPILFMEGSCIVEVPNWDPLEQSLGDILVPAGEGEFLSYTLTSVAGEFLAHIKVVDGSGEMLYRFDNNADPPHNLTIRLKLVKGGTPMGDFFLVAANGEFGVSIPMSCKLDVKPDDPAMSNRRFRLRLLDVNSNDDVDISQVQVSKDTDQGSIPLFGLVFSDLNSKGKELKVMLWTEYHE